MEAGAFKRNQEEVEDRFGLEGDEIIFNEAEADIDKDGKRLARPIMAGIEEVDSTRDEVEHALGQPFPREAITDLDYNEETGFEGLSDDAIEQMDSYIMLAQLVEDIDVKENHPALYAALDNPNSDAMRNLRMILNRGKSTPSVIPHSIKEFASLFETPEEAKKVIDELESPIKEVFDGGKRMGISTEMSESDQGKKAA